jgi:PEP-CTERM motif
VAGGVADRAGTLDAGRWQVVNSRTDHVLNSTPAGLYEAWSFSLTLPNTSWVSAVPEPASALLLLAGGAILIAARRQPRGTSATNFKSRSLWA